MPILESLIGPIASIIDKIIPDPDARQHASTPARQHAKLELLKLDGTHELDLIAARLTAIVAEAASTDPWTSRARPSFLYVMYEMLLWALPMGLIAAFRPEAAVQGHRQVVFCAVPRAPLCPPGKCAGECDARPSFTEDLRSQWSQPEPAGDARTGDLRV
jgi:hypothetical protein